jgi:hypothetical protein
MDRHLPTISRSVGIAMLHYEDTSETYIVYQYQQHQQPVETQPATGDAVHWARHAFFCLNCSGYLRADLQS